MLRREYYWGSRLAGLLLCCRCMLLFPNSSPADTLTIAVASNFQHTMNEIIGLFERSSPHRVIPVYASSGALFTQIKNGAPFDLYFSADEKRPLQCIADGTAADSSPVTYAFGKLALWAPRVRLGTAALSVLDQSAIVAIAEPNIAPYGAAAVEALRAMGRYGDVSGRLAFGKDIAQAYQYVATGSASTGFVALSQVLLTPEAKRGWYWIVPDSLHRPIRQCAVVLKRRRSPVIAETFFAGLRSGDATAIIRRSGYGVKDQQ